MTKKQLVELNHPRILLLENTKEVGDWKPEDGDDKPFICGAVWYELPKSEKALAENLGFELDYGSNGSKKVYKLGLKTTNGKMIELEKAFEESYKKAVNMYPHLSPITIKTYLL